MFSGFKLFRAFKIFGILLLVVNSIKTNAQTFVHPGLLHSAEDIERMKASVNYKQGIIYQGFIVFRDNARSQSDYHMQGPMAMVGRNPTVGQREYDMDAAAAYQNAMMWVLTGERRFAVKAIEIVDAWSLKLRSITGRDAILMAGLGPFKMVNAAEILRYTNSGWTPEEIRQTESHFRNVIYPVIKDNALFANGNWDSAAMKTSMAIGVFCNDREIFEKTLRYYVAGAGNGALLNYIINESGQCQESGRDQAHTQLGIGHLADCCEIAWHQGLDLYGYSDNRLLKGFEYTAKYNLGMDVPYVVKLDRTGKYLNKQLSTEARGKFRMIYEEVYNHYVNRMGLSAPYTQQVAEKTRPETEGASGDNIGFGTLLFSRQPVATSNKAHVAKPFTPAGLVAKTGSGKVNIISWVNIVDADHYILKRSDKKEGPYITIADHVTGSIYIDPNVHNGKLYYYTVCAANATGYSEDAYPVSIITDLPSGWKRTGITSGFSSGYAYSDGNEFILEAFADTNRSHSFMLYKDMKNVKRITARYVPQITAQSSIIGLTLRESLSDTAGIISLVLKPASAAISEAPQWVAVLSAKQKTGTLWDKSVSIPMISDTIVTNGRLTGYCWLRLEKNDTGFSGYISADGSKWNYIGSVDVTSEKPLKAGLIISSGNPAIGTTARFDNVKVE